MMISVRMRLAGKMLALFMVLIASPNAMAGPLSLYGTLYNETLPNGDSTYTFAEISTSNGNAFPIFDFTVAGDAVSGLAFDLGTGLFVAVTPGGKVIEINAATQTLSAHDISGLPASPLTNFVGIEYDPTQLPGRRVLVTYGQDVNHNLQNQIAAIDPASGAVSAFTGPLAIDDGDALGFNPLTAQLIVTDTNNPPFTAIADVFGTPSYSVYSNVFDSELYEPACAADGTMYFSRRETQDLWRLQLDPVNGDSFVRVGPHLAPTPTAWAVGLAFGVIPEPSSVFLLLVGGAGLGRLRRRRQDQNH